MYKTGQITIAATDTPQQGPDFEGFTFALSVHPSNSGPVWVHDASDSDGFPLSSEGIPGVTLKTPTGNLSEVWLSGAQDDIVCFITNPV